MTEQKELNELYDVEVDTLGLVTRGANRETFILLKSTNEEGELGEDTTQVQEPSEPQVQKEANVEANTGNTIERSLWQRIIGIFKKALEEELEGQLGDSGDEPDSPPSTNAAEVTEKVEDATEVDKSGDDTPQSLPDEQSQQLPTNSGLSAAILEVTATDLTAGLSKQEDIMDENTEVTKADVIEKSAKEVELEKSVSDLMARVEKAEQDAARERDAREHATWVQKAANITIGVPIDDYANHMHWLAKTNSKEAEWFESAFNAIAKQMEDSNLFVEKGTQRIPEDMDIVGKANALVAKGDAKSFTDALLSLPAAEQSTYLAKRRKAVKNA